MILDFRRHAQKKIAASSPVQYIHPYPHHKCLVPKIYTKFKLFLRNSQKSMLNVIRTNHRQFGPMIKCEFDHESVPMCCNTNCNSASTTNTTVNKFIRVMIRGSGTRRFCGLLLIMLAKKTIQTIENNIKLSQSIRMLVQLRDNIRMSVTVRVQPILAECLQCDSLAAGEDFTFSFMQSAIPIRQERPLLHTLDGKRRHHRYTVLLYSL